VATVVGRTSFVEPAERRNTIESAGVPVPYSLVADDVSWASLASGVSSTVLTNLLARCARVPGARS
jgi:hypothetical protein